MFVFAGAAVLAVWLRHPEGSAQAASPQSALHHTARHQYIRVSPTGFNSKAL